MGIDRVRQALEGKLKYEDLSEAERVSFQLQFGQIFSPDVEAAYAALGMQEGAVGSDENGRLVRREAGGRLVPIE
ncbi:hypothetical protein [Phenylobacterium sp. J367]|uniref:hypothetical protein n=1 Tax=Phenylobacterium sp. J367 TaxID=2898435 RepID=UPI002151EC93|nr:hypothetical protein [Phenylobacterium sp. J367]MCR5879396.1 hypothetical protein [Phenylobacterium sp. J367]